MLQDIGVPDFFWSQPSVRKLRHTMRFRVVQHCGDHIKRSLLLLISADIKLALVFPGETLSSHLILMTQKTEMVNKVLVY
jgi:hypothetical protein